MIRSVSSVQVHQTSGLRFFASILLQVASFTDLLPIALKPRFIAMINDPAKFGIPISHDDDLY
jgi:hypothetical protein